MRAKVAVTHLGHWLSVIEWQDRVELPDLFAGEVDVECSHVALEVALRQLLAQASHWTLRSDERAERTKMNGWMEGW